MESLIVEFEKALAEYKLSVGKEDRLTVFGGMLVKEFRKNRDAIVTLGQLLADFYATARNDRHQAVIVSPDEQAEIAATRTLGRQ